MYPGYNYSIPLRSDNNGVLEAILLFEKSHNVCHSRSLLSDSDIDAIERLRVISHLVDTLLVDDCVNSDGCLSGLSVSNDQFTLTSSDWDLNII